MNRDYLKQIMIDQKETYLNNPMINRDYPLEDNVNYCFVGIRRTGKSYMMYQQIKHLQENGIPLKQIVYVNFEDERLLELSADDLNLPLKEKGYTDREIEVTEEPTIELVKRSESVV